MFSPRVEASWACRMKRALKELIFRPSYEVNLTFLSVIRACRRKIWPSTQNRRKPIATCYCAFLYGYYHTDTQDTFLPPSP